MGKMVGLSRNLKMTWLNKAVELLSENLPEQEYKDRLKSRVLRTCVKPERF